MDRTVLAISSCSSTPILGVHEINKKSCSLCLKNRFLSQFSVFMVRSPGSVRVWKPCILILKSFERVVGKLNKSYIIYFVSFSPIIIYFLFFFSFYLVNFFDVFFFYWYINFSRMKIRFKQNGKKEHFY